MASLAEITGSSTLNSLKKRMLKSTEGRKLLVEKPTLNSSVLELDKLSKFPKDSLGLHYSQFMIKNNLTSDSRTQVTTN